MKISKKLTLLLLLFGSLNLFSQNDPNLHVEGNISTSNLLIQGFEGTMGSFVSGGSSGWTFTTAESYNGSYSAQTSFSIYGNSTLERSIVIPPNSTGEVSFYYKVSASGYPYFYNSGSYTALIANGSWNYFSTTIPDGTQTVGIYLGNYYSGNTVTMNLDYVRVDYTSDYAVRITDGNQGSGKVLTSDANGNATWRSTNELINDYNIFDPLTIYNSSYEAISISNSGGNGILIGSATSDGIKINNSGMDGISVINSNDDGIYINDSADEGIYIDDSGDFGLIVRSSEIDGVYSYSNDGYSGYFSGDLYGSTLSKGSGTFMIDHPLDPENKYMYHSFVESPDMMNIYNGNVTLDANGEAEVEMEDWFDALNKDFRYQLTAIGSPGPNLYIAEEITDNIFRIAGGSSNMKVSWTVTGVRKDAHAEANRVEVEVDKPQEFKGFYLDAEAHGMPFERSIDYVKQKGDREDPKKDKKSKEVEERSEVPVGVPLLPKR